MFSIKKYLVQVVLVYLPSFTGTKQNIIYCLVRIKNCKVLEKNQYFEKLIWNL